MNVLLLTAHSIAEYDDVRMFTDMGADVFSIGAYSDPSNPGDSMRPALPNAPDHPELRERVIASRERHPGEGDAWAIDWAKADLDPAILDWADVIICHHYLDRWVIPQWDRLRDHRVIWRTCGQSDPYLEMAMRPLRNDGLEIVRYSPKERATFEPLGVFAGSDRMIRFGKYPSDYPAWHGTERFVTNVTQDLPGRGDHVGLGFWLEATAGLPARPIGPKSEQLGGYGALPFDQMLERLAAARAYLYMGTVPASYTLGLIEAMLVGIPVVSIHPDAWFGPPDLFEGADLAGNSARTPEEAARMLRLLLDGDPAVSDHVLTFQRGSVAKFHMESVAPMWADFLGLPQVPSIEVFK